MFVVVTPKLPLRLHILKPLFFHSVFDLHLILYSLLEAVLLSGVESSWMVTITLNFASDAYQTLLVSTPFSV